MILNSRSDSDSVAKAKTKSLIKEEAFGKRSSVRASSIVYNEFDQIVRRPNRSKFAIKIIGVALFFSLMLGGVIIASGVNLSTGQANNIIEFKYLSNEFNSSSLYTSSNQAIIQPFANEIYSNARSFGLESLKPVGITLYTTKSLNLWSVNLNKTGNYYWVQVAVLTDKGCAYFLSNHSPSSIFGAGIGEWYATTDTVSGGCSSSVTPSGKAFTGWTKFQS